MPALCLLFHAWGSFIVVYAKEETSVHKQDSLENQLVLHIVGLKSYTHIYKPENDLSNGLSTVDYF